MSQPLNNNPHTAYWLRADNRHAFASVARAWARSNEDDRHDHLVATVPAWEFAIALLRTHRQAMTLGGEVWRAFRETQHELAFTCHIFSNKDGLLNKMVRLTLDGRFKVEAPSPMLPLPAVHHSNENNETSSSTTFGAAAADRRIGAVPAVPPTAPAPNTMVLSTPLSTILGELALNALPALELLEFRDVQFAVPATRKRSVEFVLREVRLLPQPLVSVWLCSCFFPDFVYNSETGDGTENSENQTQNNNRNSAFGSSSPRSRRRQQQATTSLASIVLSPSQNNVAPVIVCAPPTKADAAGNGNNDSNSTTAAAGGGAASSSSSSSAAAARQSAAEARQDAAAAAAFDPDRALYDMLRRGVAASNLSPLLPFAVQNLLRPSAVAGLKNFRFVGTEAQLRSLLRNPSHLACIANSLRVLEIASSLEDEYDDERRNQLADQLGDDPDDNNEDEDSDAQREADRLNQQYENLLLSSRRAEGGAQGRSQQQQHNHHHNADNSNMAAATDDDNDDDPEEQRRRIRAAQVDGSESPLLKWRRLGRNNINNRPAPLDTVAAQQLQQSLLHHEHTSGNVVDDSDESPSAVYRRQQQQNYDNQQHSSFPHSSPTNAIAASAETLDGSYLDAQIEAVRRKRRQRRPIEVPIARAGALARAMRLSKEARDNLAQRRAQLLQQQQEHHQQRGGAGAGGTPVPSSASISTAATIRPATTSTVRPSGGSVAVVAPTRPMWPVLTKVVLRGLRWRTVSPVLGTLPSLSHLDLAHNRIVSLLEPFPVLASSLHLTTLILSHNRLRSIGDGTSAGLSSAVTHLDVSHNLLASFNGGGQPLGLPALVSLRHLDVSHNYLYYWADFHAVVHSSWTLNTIVCNNNPFLDGARSSIVSERLRTAAAAGSTLSSSSTENQNNSNNNSSSSHVFFTPDELALLMLAYTDPACAELTTNGVTVERRRMDVARAKALAAKHEPVLRRLPNVLPQAVSGSTAHHMGGGQLPITPAGAGGGAAAGGGGGFAMANPGATSSSADLSSQHQHQQQAYNDGHTVRSFASNADGTGSRVIVTRRVIRRRVIRRHHGDSSSSSSSESGGKSDLDHAGESSSSEDEPNTDQHQQPFQSQIQQNNQQQQQQQQPQSAADDGGDFSILEDHHPRKNHHVSSAITEQFSHLNPAIHKFLHRAISTLYAVEEQSHRSHHHDAASAAANFFAHPPSDRHTGAVLLEVLYYSEEELRKFDEEKQRRAAEEAEARRHHHRHHHHHHRDPEQAPPPPPPRYAPGASFVYAVGVAEATQLWRVALIRRPLVLTEAETQQEREATLTQILLPESTTRLQQKHEGTWEIVTEFAVSDPLANGGFVNVPSASHSSNNNSTATTSTTATAPTETHQRKIFVDVTGDFRVAFYVSTTTASAAQRRHLEAFLIQELRLSCRVPTNHNRHHQRSYSHPHSAVVNNTFSILAGGSQRPWPIHVTAEIFAPGSIDGYYQDFFASDPIPAFSYFKIPKFLTKKRPDNSNNRIQNQQDQQAQNGDQHEEEGDDDPIENNRIHFVSIDYVLDRLPPAGEVGLGLPGLVPSFLDNPKVACFAKCYCVVDGDGGGGANNENNSSNNSNSNHHHHHHLHSRQQQGGGHSRRRVNHSTFCWAEFTAERLLELVPQDEHFYEEMRREKAIWQQRLEEREEAAAVTTGEEHQQNQQNQHEAAQNNNQEHRHDADWLCSACSGGGGGGGGGADAPQPWWASDIRNILSHISVGPAMESLTLYAGSNLNFVSGPPILHLITNNATATASLLFQLRNCLHPVKILCAIEKMAVFVSTSNNVGGGGGGGGAASSAPQQQQQHQQQNNGKNDSSFEKPVVLSASLHEKLLVNRNSMKLEHVEGCAVCIVAPQFLGASDADLARAMNEIEHGNNQTEEQQRLERERAEREAAAAAAQHQQQASGSGFFSSLGHFGSNVLSGAGWFLGLGHGGSNNAAGGRSDDGSSSESDGEQRQQQQAREGENNNSSSSSNTAKRRARRQRRKAQPLWLPYCAPNAPGLKWLSGFFVEVSLGEQQQQQQNEDENEDDDNKPHALGLVIENRVSKSRHQQSEQDAEEEEDEHETLRRGRRGQLAAVFSRFDIVSVEVAEPPKVAVASSSSSSSSSSPSAPPTSTSQQQTQIEHAEDFSYRYESVAAVAGGAAAAATTTASIVENDNNDENEQQRQMTPRNLLPTSIFRPRNTTTDDENNSTAAPIPLVAIICIRTASSNSSDMLLCIASQQRSSFVRILRKILYSSENARRFPRPMSIASGLSSDSLRDGSGGGDDSATNGGGGGGFAGAGARSSGVGGGGRRTPAQQLVKVNVMNVDDWASRLPLPTKLRRGL